MALMYKIQMQIFQTSIGKRKVKGNIQNYQKIHQNTVKALKKINYYSNIFILYTVIVSLDKSVEHWINLGIFE